MGGRFHFAAIVSLPVSPSADAKLTGTVVGHPPQTSVPLYSVGLVQERRVGNQEVDAGQVDVQVEVVVGHVHAIVRVLRAQPGRPLHGAGEVGVGGRKRRLPHLGELVHQPRIGGLVGLVVHKDDGALAGQDHAGQGGPIAQRHGDLGRRVHVVDQTGALDDRREVSGRHVVVITNQNGHYVVWMGAQPLGDGDEIVLQGPNIQQFTGGVAEIDGVVGVMRLKLH